MTAGHCAPRGTQFASWPPAFQHISAFLVQRPQVLVGAIRPDPLDTAAAIREKRCRDRQYTHGRKESVRNNHFARRVNEVSVRNGRRVVATGHPRRGREYRLPLLSASRGTTKGATRTERDDHLARRRTQAERGNRLAHLHEGHEASRSLGLAKAEHGVDARNTDQARQKRSAS